MANGIVSCNPLHFCVRLACPTSFGSSFSLMLCLKCQTRIAELVDRLHRRYVNLILPLFPFITITDDDLTNWTFLIGHYKCVATSVLNNMSNMTKKLLNTISSYVFVSFRTLCAYSKYVGSLRCTKTAYLSHFHTLLFTPCSNLLYNHRQRNLTGCKDQCRFPSMALLG
jgi:hypothetical protein